MKKVDIICGECKIEFKVPYKRRSRKYCSLSCSAKAGNKISKEKRSLKAKQRFKDNPELRKKLSETAKLTNSKRIYKPLSEETKRKISLNNKGGRCNWYEFEKKNGDVIKVQGSYELEFAKTINEIDENWIKPTIWDRKHQFQWFDSNGKSHWYTPDFYSPKLNKYFETKGFWAKNMLEKKKFVETLNNVEIIYKEKLKTKL